MATGTVVREIIKIDEDLCDGCGLCIPACPEGALAIVDGKARLVSEVRCDGMGACLGECPHDAIIIERREAEPFDEELVEQEMTAAAIPEAQIEAPPAQESLPCGCPGSAVQMFDREQPVAAADNGDGAMPASQLRNWPVELMLAPPQAPSYENARLLISADCVPFAYAGFHQRLLAGRVLLVGCPKLDDAAFYRRKLAQIFAHNEIASVDVAFMEVPCCLGLVQVVKQAIADSGKDIPAHAVRIGIEGELQRQLALADLPF